MTDVPTFIDEPVVDPNSMTDRELLIRMDGKITTGFTVLVQAQTNLVEQGRDHEARLRSLEKARWYMAGAAAVLGVIGSQVMQTIFPTGH